MDFNNFTMSDGVTVSIFAMLVVFLILIMLSLILTTFKYLPKDAKKEPVKVSSSRANFNDNDEEEKMVAMLTASALAKENYPGNVKIKSIKRIG